MKHLLTILLTLAACLAATAQNACDQIAANPNRCGSNHYAYPYPAEALPQLTDAPAGYEPFFINHYGRHGSRWLTHKENYDRPVEQLLKAARHNKLTSRGKQLLTELQFVQAQSQGRIGELSDVGAEQHRGIAHRMVENFPQVFSDGATVDARSTIIIRCILSMLNATGEIRALCPGIDVATDASVHDMHYTGWGYGEDTLANYQRSLIRHTSDSIFKARIRPARFLKQIVNDDAFVADSLNGLKLMEDVFDIAGTLQNHHVFDGMSLYDLFTNDELCQLWQCKNIYWYLQWSNSPQGGNRMPFIEKALLHNMIATADDAIAHDRHGAALRFGHETCLLPLACLMELDSVNYSCHNLDDLHNHWQNFNIFPMGCNIQMVFYRRADSRINPDDILVKVLLNEHEARLPIATTQFPYYNWQDYKRYLQRKLTRVITWPAPVDKSKLR